MCDHNSIFGEDIKKCTHTMHPSVPECLICPECGEMIPWEWQKDLLLKKIKNNYEKIFGGEK